MDLPVKYKNLKFKKLNITDVNSFLRYKIIFMVSQG